MNDNWLWDLDLSEREVRSILSNPNDPRFTRIAALMLARVNDPKEVLGNYIGQEAFCQNWARIKREMRKNKWDEPRIIWWQAVQEKVYEKLKASGFRIRKKRINEPLGPLYRDLGHKIREIRKSHNISQAELAERIGTSQQWVSLVEQGKVNLTLNLLERISGATGTGLGIEFSNENKNHETTG